MRLKSNLQSTYRSTIAAAAAHPWGIALALCAIPAAVYGQASIIPASPITADTPAIQQSMPQRSGLITLDFRDVAVVELITMIAQQGNVGIIIGPDVDDSIRIPYISLKDETPQDAIKKATLSAGLKWEKVDDKTFMVGKNLVGVSDTPRATDNGNNLPLLPFGAPPSTPAPGNLPDILNNRTRQGSVYTPMPDLYGVEEEDKSRNDQPAYAMIKVHNVRPDIIAYWIDPVNHPMPPEYRAAQQGVEHAINQHPLQSGVDPNVWSQLTSNSYGSVNPYSGYVPNPYANPYANPYGPSAPLGYGAQFNQPYFQGSAQFGNRGGGRGGNRGGFGGGGSGGSNSAGILESPKGIGTIVSIDAQNTLLVYGTQEGVNNLKQIIDYLDRPIRQVEIEAQFVDVGTTDAKAFGLNVSTRTNIGNSSSSNNVVASNFGTIPSVEGGTSLTARFGNYQATLRALVSNKKARIVNSPRVTTLNNLTAFLFSATSTPIVLSSSTSGIGGQVGSQQNAFFLTTSIGLVVTPTINNDDTITVFLTPQVQVQTPVQTTQTSAGGGNNSSSNQNTASSIPSFTSQYLTTVATVKDGDTIVLGGLRTKNVSYTENRVPVLSSLPIIGNLFKSRQKNDDDRELVIFLTARILHRTDDLSPLPGT